MLVLMIPIVTAQEAVEMAAEPFEPGNSGWSCIWVVPAEASKAAQMMPAPWYSSLQPEVLQTEGKLAVAFHHHERERAEAECLDAEPVSPSRRR